MSTNTLVILAAGMGSRYGGLKQLAAVGPSQETILDYAIYDALRAGFARVVFVIRHDFEAAFRDAVGRRYEGLCEVAYSFQETSYLPAGTTVPAERRKPLGTGHAVWCARADIRGPFVVINADDFYGRDALQALGRHLSSGASDRAQGCMAGYRLSDTLSDYGPVSRGICTTDSAQNLVSVTEHTALSRRSDGCVASGASASFTGQEWVSMNCWGLPAGTAELFEPQLAEFLLRHTANPSAEFYLPAAVATLVSTGRLSIKVIPTAGPWFGITYPDDRPRVEAALRGLVASGVYPSPLWPAAQPAATP